MRPMPESILADFNAFKNEGKPMTDDLASWLTVFWRMNVSHFVGSEIHRKALLQYKIRRLLRKLPFGERLTQKFSLIV